MSYVVNVAVQHAPWDEQRRDMLRELHASLAGQPHHPDLGVQYVGVSMDNGTKEEPEGVWPSNRRAWFSCCEKAGATHALVLQEDMRPAAGFWAAALRAIRLRPYDVIVFLTARAAAAKAREQGRSWVELPDGTWGGATLMPIPAVEDFLAFADVAISERCPSADARVDLWLRSTDRRAYATVPSLIQHIGDRSIMGHSGKRVARVPAIDGSEFRPGRDLRAVKSPRALHQSMFVYLSKEFRP